MPKYGILSIIVDACVSGVIDDAYLVPIGINYEKLVDGNFVRELLGQPKQMETFWSALKGIWSVVNSNYGSVQIDFSQPFSLRVSTLKTTACTDFEYYQSILGINSNIPKIK